MERTAEHLSDHDIERYQRRALSPSELLAASRHLAGCDQCHRRVTGGRDVVSQVRDSLIGSVAALRGRDADHLNYEQLAALVDDKVDDVDREIAMVHLEVCPQCAEELRGLQELKSAPQQRSIWTWQRLASAAAVLLVAGIAIWTLTRSWLAPSDTADATRAGATAPPNSASPLRILVTLKDGSGEIALDDAGNLRGLDVADTAAREGIKAALTTGKLKLGSGLDSLQGRSGVLMGAPGDGVPFALLSPLGVVVQSDRPALRWRPLDGASAYVVRIYDTRFVLVASSQPQTGTEWVIAHPLTRGATYVWQVTAITNSGEIKSPAPPAPDARFKVLGRDEAAEIQREEKAYVNSHLALGTVYAAAGLLDEAERELRLLLDANPDSQIVKDLLRDIATARTRK